MNAPAQKYQMAAVADIVPGKNVRTKIGNIDELVESVLEHGILEPLMVRPRDGKLELVFGFRRFAAAQRGGLDQVPVLVRDMEDATVLELQLAENVERADMPPLDEAEGFARLLKFPGYDLARVAEKVSRPVSFVAQRLKLLELCREAKKALDEDQITLAVALLIARIPDQKLQTEALKEVGGSQWEPPMKAKEAFEHIEENFMLRLDQAPFDITDAKLVPKAGACTACPKRTGAQRELFADVKSADLCTDPACHRGKVDALWKIRKKEAQAGGTAVLEGNEAKSALHHGSNFRELDDDVWSPDGKRTTVKKLFGKNLPPVTLARTEDGKVHELVKRADVEKILREKNGGKRVLKDDPLVARNKREDAKKKLRQRAVTQALALAVERVPRLGSDQVLALLVRGLIKRSWNDVQQAVIRRRKLEEPPTKDAKKRTVRRVQAEERLLAYAEKLTDHELMGLGLELALRTEAPGKWSPATPVWGQTLRVLGIDFAKLEAAVTAEAKEAKKTGKGKKIIVHLMDGAGAACGAKNVTAANTNPSKVTCVNCQHAAGIAGADRDDGDIEVRTCRGCGCTDLEGCDGGCEWVEDDLCSNCAGAQPKGKRPGKAKAKAEAKAATAAKAAKAAKASRPKTAKKRRKKKG